MEVVSTERFAIRSEADAATVRRAARDLAQQLGFDAFATAAVTTATSELSRNVFVHGGGGHAIVETLDAGGRKGIRIRFADEGPGIADVERALRGGWSSGRSLGLGLSGSRRLVDEFRLESTPGAGTHIEVIKWARIRR